MDRSEFVKQVVKALQGPASTPGRVIVLAGLETVALVDPGVVKQVVAAAVDQGRMWQCGILSGAQ